MEFETEDPEIVPQIDLDELEREKSQEYFTNILEMFPDVDTAFLELKCIEFAFDKIMFNDFLEETMLKNNYPKQKPITSVESTEEKSDQVKFCVETFAENFPNPEEYFSMSKHGSKFISHSVEFLQDK